MFRLAGLGLLVAAVAAGCGGGGGQSLLAETASNLGKIKSGTLGLTLIVTPRGSAARNPFGFELHGPFALAKANQLPKADIDYTQIANGKRATVTLVSTGQKAYAIVGDKAYELPASSTDRLRSSGGDSSTTLSRLDITDWVQDPSSTSCGDAKNVDCARANLDVVSAANDLLDLGSRLTGETYPRISGRNGRELRDAVDSATMKVATGEHDRLLRSLVIDVDLGLDVPKVLKTELGNIVGAKVHFALTVGRPNRPVNVKAPANALPSSELPLG